MGSSRASTPAGRRRTAKRAAAAKPASRKRSAPHTKKSAAAGGTKRPAKPKRASAPPKKPKQAKRAKPKPSSPRWSKQAWAARAPRIVAWLAVVTTILAGVYFFWFRDSSFVRVEQVQVRGAEGPEAEAIVNSLTKQAEKMTTLHVDRGALERSVSNFATVVGLDVDADLPHGLVIDVTGRPPVFNAVSGERSVAVAADGTLLNGVDASDADIPNVEVRDIPAQGKANGEALEIATVAGAAPDPLRALIENVEPSGKEGMTVTLKGGIPVVFGDESRADEKWAAAAAVLADPKVKTLTQLDVRVPERPSIGGAAPAPEATEPEPVTP